LVAYLIELKRRQYKRTFTYDIFSHSWIRNLVFNLHAGRAGTVKGILSVLYAGQQPVALHYGLLEGDLLHYWFPAYDPHFAFASPGTELFLQVARYGPETGSFVAIDMGYGEQAYKHKLTNVQTEMSVGTIDPNPLRRAIHQAKLTAWFQRKRLPFRRQVRTLARRLAPALGRSQYGQ
jgi:CelD/BcsL family acetyltransferase involved in cellulose biosynthesis